MKWSTEKKIMVSVVVAVALLLINGIISYRATHRLIDSESQVRHTYQVLLELEGVLSTVKDAETGGRGYYITGQDSYLEPYRDAMDQIHSRVERLRQLTADSPTQQARIPNLERLIADRLARIKTGIESRQSGNSGGTRQIVASGVGKKLMDDLRKSINEMESEENDLLKRRAEGAKISARGAFLTDSVADLIAFALIALITYIIIRDVTARKRAEEALRQQREWLQVTLASIGDAVIATDTSGSVTFLNPIAQSLTGWKPEEAVGQSLQQVFHIVNEETRKVVENPALRAMKEGVIIGLANHTLLIAKDGAETPIDDSGAPIKDAEGKMIGAVLIFRDITERRKAEQTRALLAGIVESSEDAIISKNLDGIIGSWNAAAERLFEYSASEAIGQPITIIIPPDRIEEEQMIVDRFRQGERIKHFETVRLSKSGRALDISLTVSPVRDTAGRIIGASKISRDITDRKRAEQERTRLLASERAAREQAEAASRAKDEFVAVISHEIRSPLNSMLGWAQMLRMGKLDQAETIRAIETIERNARAQVQLIEDLLDISRVITGKLVLNVRPVELTQIIEAALDSIRPAADAKAIQLHVHLAPQSGLVSGDPNRLQQIVWNLLSNAVKFTPTRGRIEVKVERINSQLQITVSDSGVGISPQFLPYVFDRFSQASTSSERKYGGLGLGLAIVRHLVELHGGTVQADSPGEGQGATFTVALPVRVAAEETSEFELAEVTADAVASVTDAIMLDGLRIMVVDDEPESRDLLKVILTRRGAEVKTCASAAEVLETVESWQPSILVSDIGMPDEDGYALIRKLRERGPEHGGNIPAVALTGYARTEDRMRTLAAGFQMHVSKPVEAVELIMVIASLAGRMGKG